MDDFKFTPDEVQSTSSNDDLGFSFTPDEVQPDFTKLKRDAIDNSVDPIGTLTTMAKNLAGMFASSSLSDTGEAVGNAVYNTVSGAVKNKDVLSEYAKELPKTLVATGMKIGEKVQNVGDLLSQKASNDELYQFEGDSKLDLIPEAAKGFVNEAVVTTPKMMSDITHWIGSNMKDPTGKKSNNLSDALLSISEGMKNISEYMGDVELIKSKATSLPDGSLSWGQIGSVLGHGAGQGATMAVMAGTLGPKAAYGFYALAGGADVYKQSYEKDGDAGKANTLATINAASTYMIDRWFDPLPENIATGARMTAKEVAKEISKAIVKEPMAEGLQQVLAENLVRKIGLDAEQDLFEGVAEAMIGAFGGAAAMGGASAISAYSAERHYEEAKAKAVELGADPNDVEQYKRATIAKFQQHPEAFDTVFQKNVQQTINEINTFVKENGDTEEVRKAMQVKADLDEVYNRVYEQIKTGDNDKVAAAQAKVVQGVALWGSQELGISPLEYYEQRFPRIERTAFKEFNRKISRAKRAGEKVEINLYEALKNPKLLRGHKKKDKRESLTTFLQSRGGLIDAGGELKGMDANKQVKGLINNKDGNNLDDAALAAWEAGYFPQNSERPSINELLEAIDEELRGNKRFASEAEENLQNQVNELAEELDRIDIDWRNMEPKEIEMAVDAYVERQRAYNEGMGQEQEGDNSLAWFQESLDVARENEDLDANNPVYEGETINIDGVECTVYNSNGDRIAQSEPALRNFYNWFGDSKVVDEQGRPKVVYHGTNKEFDTFDKKLLGTTTLAYSAKQGFFFTDSEEVANSYGDYAAIYQPINELRKKQEMAERWGDWDTVDELTIKIEELDRKISQTPANERGQKIYPVYLKADNVLEYDAKDEYFSDIGDEINDVLLKAKKQGKDGVVLKNLKDQPLVFDEKSSNHFVVFEPNQIKSTSNSGAFDPSDNRIYYQGGEDENLVMTHSARIETLDGIIETGSLIAPSMAITNKTQGTLNDFGFGEVVFVRNPDSIDYKKDNIYDRDIYSPRLPAPVYKTKEEGYIYSYEYDSMRREWMYDQEKFKQRYHGKTFDEIFKNAEKYIFKGYTPSGTRKYAAYTPNNVIAEMKKQGLLNGENVGYGLNSFLASLAKKQTSLKKLKAQGIDLGRVEKEVMDKLRKDYDDFEGKLKEYAKKDYQSYSMFMDVFPEVMNAIATNKPYILNQYMDMNKLQEENPELLKEVKDFIATAVTAKRTYFESKPMRELPLSEFSAVLVTEGVTEEQKQKLRNLGLEVIDYKRGEANEALEKAQSKVFFQLSSQEEENFTEMYINEGKQAVLDWIDRQVRYYNDMAENEENEAVREYFRKSRDKRLAWLKDVEDFINNLDKSGTSKPVAIERENDKSIDKEAKKYFGTTYNLNEAGYILADGSLLDFSGKKEGGRAGQRSYDHREISSAFESRNYDIDMEAFVNNGAIRFMPESNSLFIANVPTAKQMSIIKHILEKANGEINIELVNDAKNMGTSSSFYKEFDAGTNIKNVKNAINAYFSGNISKLQEFFQDKDNTLYRDPKGAFSQRIGQRALISLFERADASTFMHETAHFFFEELKAFAKTSKKSADMLNTINEWLGYDGVAYTEAQIEQFARGFEQYLREGKAPSNYLKRVFDAFLSWMRNLYKTARELNVQLNDDVRSVYANILGGTELDKYMDAAPAEVLGNSKKYWKAKREAMDEIYAQNNQAKKVEKQFLKKTRQSLQKTYEDMANYLSDAIVPLEEEIKQISPDLYNMNRRLEIAKINKTNAYYKRVKGFVEGMSNMNENDFHTFDLALKNRDVDTVQRLLAKYDLEAGFVEVRTILDDLREQMIDVGVDVAYMPDYFPRKIKDADGLLDYVEQTFGDSEQYSIIQKMLEEKRKDGRVRTKEDEAQIVNSLIRGYAGGISIAKIGNVKERSIDVVDQYMNKYYKVSTDALVDYISGSVQMIENKKYFGRETKELQNLRRMVANRETTIAEYKEMEPQEAKWKEIKTRNYKIGAVEAQIRNTYDNDLKAELQDRKTKLEAEVEYLKDRRAEQVKDIAITRMEVELAQVKKEVEKLADSKIENSVGNLLFEMAEQGRITHTQELRLKELLLARFSNQGLGNEFWRLVRDGGYIWTLGNFESAITQFGDLGTSAYKNGLWNTAFEYAKAWAGKSEITIDDLGLGKVIQDGGYADTSAFSQILDKVLKYTGFEKMDKIAKQTLVNSSIRKAREQAANDDPRLEEYLRHEFGEKWVDVKEDMKTGAITDEIMEYAMFQLLDVQPITIDQMPRYYAEGGKKRLFYMMKSYFIKQLNEYRKICFETAKKDPEKAVIDLTRLTVYLMLFNAGADLLKDLLFGRPIDVKDTLVNNIFIGGSINRYQAMSVKREGLFKTLQKQLLFPVMMDEVIVDVLSDKDVANWNTWKNIPLVGRPYYWWFGGGHLKTEKEEKKLRNQRRKQRRRKRED